MKQQILNLGKSPLISNNDSLGVSNTSQLTNNISVIFLYKLV